MPERTVPGRNRLEFEQITNFWAAYGTGEPVVDGRVVCAHDRVAIVGATPGREVAPFDDEKWCVWAINEIPQPYFTRHFELHPMSVQSPRDFAGLRGIAAPCYVLGNDDYLQHVR